MRTKGRIGKYLVLSTAEAGSKPLVFVALQSKVGKEGAHKLYGSLEVPRTNSGDRVLPYCTRSYTRRRWRLVRVGYLHETTSPRPKRAKPKARGRNGHDSQTKRFPTDPQSESEVREEGKKEKKNPKRNRRRKRKKSVIQRPVRLLFGSSVAMSGSGVQKSKSLDALTGVCS